MEAFDNEPMSSYHASFKASASAQPVTVTCECSECKKELGKSQVEGMVRRLAATQDWLAALREYRSKNDLEFLRDQAGQVPEYTNRLRLLAEPS